jgi:hypothetical protein
VAMDGTGDSGTGSRPNCSGARSGDGAPEIEAAYTEGLSGNEFWRCVMEGLGSMVNPSVSSRGMTNVVIQLCCLDPHGLGGRNEPKTVVVMWIAVHVRLVWSVARHVERAEVLGVTVGDRSLEGRRGRAVGTCIGW